MELATREQIETKYKWDLTGLFTSVDNWEKAFKEAEKELPGLQKYQGTLANSPLHFQKAIEFYLDLNRKLEKLYTFAHLKSDEDTTDTKNYGFLGRIHGLYTKFLGATSFIIPELIALADNKLEELLNASEVAPYKRMLKDWLRYKAHTLSKAEENLLALGAEVFGAPSTIFSQLNDADFDFGKIKVDNEKHPLSHETFSLFLKNQNRDVRKKAFNQFYQVFEDHEHALAALLSSSIKKDVYLARAKKFDSAVSLSLFSDSLDLRVYNNLVSTVTKNLEPLHRYYELRKKILKIDQQKIFDTYVPLVKDTKFEFPYEKAVETILQALKPLGEEYQIALRRGLTSERWVDVYENKGKRSGAYSSGCYDSHPYVLLNHNDSNLNDLFTIAHEVGHSMHSYFSRKNQPYQDSDYTIFVAEVASTFNEQLLLKHLLEENKNNPEARVFLLNHQIDSIKATLFRQTMFAEFELITHEMHEKGQALTVTDFRKVYKKLLKKYFGPAVGIGKKDELEFSRIPHFYSAFYVYKYATGISAAIALSEKVLSADTQARNNYLNFLKSGGSKKPLELLKDAGVDMSQPEPISTAIGKFEVVLEELEKSLTDLTKE